MVKVKSIREVWPNWPSELDAAKSSVIWAGMAQEFYSAARVLDEEYADRKNRRNLTDIQSLTRLFIRPPANFCSAFALELAAKAAILAYTRGKGIEDKKRPFFSGHDSLRMLEKHMPSFELSEAEKDILREAKTIVTNGKYPVAIEPDDSIALSSNSRNQRFIERAAPIYEKLMAFQKVHSDASN